MKTNKAQATRALTSTAAMLALSACSPSMMTLNHLAHAGKINQTAPVIAHVQLEIAAPPARVWALLVNAPAWQTWDPDITNVSVTQPLALGTRFVWHQGSSTIHSQVQLLNPSTGSAGRVPPTRPRLCTSGN